jgi:hypothetical protein
MAHVHLVLDVEVRLGQEGEQFRDVREDPVPEVRLDQGVDREGRGGDA